MALKDILPGKLGFGTAPLGNMFRAIPEDEARATVEAAWADGIRYFDTAPFYGAGLAEIRLGDALRARPREEYVVSTKVGRLILDEVEDVNARDLGEKGDVFKYAHSEQIAPSPSSLRRDDQGDRREQRKRGIAASAILRRRTLPAAVTATR